MLFLGPARKGHNPVRPKWIQRPVCDHRAASTQSVPALQRTTNECAQEDLTSHLRRVLRVQCFPGTMSVAWCDDPIHGYGP